MEDLLTSDEVAYLLKIQPYTVREWAKEGRLKGRKYGRMWRFKREDIQAFIDMGDGLDAREARD
jgi:excisionase family DNA binding protein